MENKETTHEITNSQSPLCLVGIGASAGGLEAMGELLKNLPDNTGMAFAIIQHLAPDYKSMLPEILCNYTMMPVIQATNGMTIEKNTVYLIPPKYNMEIKNGRLTLYEYVHTNSVNHPIDIFFNSLAKNYEGRAIAVVLSGTGSDGTNGIRTIKEQGGMIIVQRPETAQFDGMPRSAIQTGFADACLSPIEIAEELGRIASSVSEGSEGLTNDELLSKIYSILKKVSNINYTYYKQTTITRRIERRMMINHITNLYDYVNMLRANNEEATQLAKDVLIGVTSFFRDAECFEVLKEKVIIPLVRNATPGKPIRVWIAGCSTGEEAYSAAILFREAMDELGKDCDVKIFATDLDKDSILSAGKGQYGDNIIGDVSAYRLSRFFTKKGKHYFANRDIRKMIVFSPHNVFQDPPFGKLNLIMCRNMLIYFQSVLQKDLFSIFHMALNDNGYLFLGKSETVNSFGSVFELISPNEKIYMHVADGQVPEEYSPRYRFVPSLGDYVVPERPDIPDDVEENEREMRLSVLEEFMPASVIVDGRGMVHHTFGNCENYIHFPRGKVEMSLFANLANDLNIPVSTALKTVRDTKKRMTYDRIALRGERKEEVISLSVAPLNDKYGQPTDFTVIVFGSEKYELPVSETVRYDIDEAASKRITDLEKDLVRTKDGLRKAITDRESANEELQAANEELLTANEELQSSNEELQSVNEELYTVNSEYQEKLSEVTSLNDDISNFLSSTLIGIMFLDLELNIRRYTDYLAKEFNIMEQDVGRSVKFLGFNFVNIDLVETAQRVLSSLVTEQLNMISASGKSYLMRVAPYRTEGNQILGLVLTFVDTTFQNNNSQQLQDMEAALSHARKSSQDKDSFLSQMSHDMRTPLNAILGAVQLSYDKAADKPELKESLDTIYDNSRYLVSIIGDILETSRLRAGKIQIVQEPTNEKEMLNGIMAMMQPEAQKNNISLTFTSRGVSDKILMIDKNHVKEVLINLLSNALKFTPSGGKVEMSAEVIAGVDGKFSHIYTVSDTGCGISKEFQKKMYSPFEREDRGENKAQGSGLGLYIGRQLVIGMGGKIDCLSTENVGTQFVVVLNYEAAPENAVRSAALDDIDLSVLEGKNVLVCDDNSVNLKIAEQMLTRVKTNVIKAENGKEAVEAFANSGLYSIDAILMDIRMPVMDGCKATTEIRALKRSDARAVPIIGMTADVGEEDKKSFNSAGMNDSICKPVDMNVLYKTLIGYLKQ